MKIEAEGNTEMRNMSYQAAGVREFLDVVGTRMSEAMYLLVAQVVLAATLGPSQLFGNRVTMRALVVRNSIRDS